MSIDPATPLESQNVCIRQLIPGKYLTLLAAQTAADLTPVQLEAMARKMKAFFGVDALQVACSTRIPDFGEEYDGNLHVSAQFQPERKPSQEKETTEPVTETNTSASTSVPASPKIDEPARAMAAPVVPVAEAATIAEPAMPLEATPAVTSTVVPSATDAVGTPTPSNESI